MSRIPVGVLGATGMVGRHYIALLENHPWFEVTYVAASARSAGRPYAEAVANRWHLPSSVPEAVAGLTVHGIDALDEAKKHCRFVFSALDSDVAGAWESQYAAAGVPVVSNASAHRHDPDVPVLIPEINHAHADVIPAQRRNRGWPGFIAVKPNCSLQSYLTPLYALHEQFGIAKAVVTTMQAVSGAGFSSVEDAGMVDNIVPFIRGEEEKSEQEPLRILGRVDGAAILDADRPVISAHCNRVAATHGHLATVSVQFDRKPEKTQVLDAWKTFKSLPQDLHLPSAPEQPIIYHDEADRPQTRLDRDAGNGMAVSVGRLRDCRVLDYRFVSLSHNIIRGAAGGGILNAELLKAKGYLE